MASFQASDGAKSVTTQKRKDTYFGVLAAANTTVTEFILVGLIDNPDMKVIGFLTFFMIYLITLIGNLGLVTVIKADAQLHTPMYYFISHLAFLDVCYSSAILPKILDNILEQNATISFNECAAQMYFLIIPASSECYLLAAMAYDRYAAICKPLLYSFITSQRVCYLLVAGSYLVGFINATTQTYLTFRLSFCGSSVINHFVCDIPPLLSLSCSATYVNEFVLFVFAIFLGVFTSSEILLPYICILGTILRIQSAKGRQKAFSTCATHLCSVVLFYGTSTFLYMRSASDYSLGRDKVISVFYTVVIPVLNPMIYSLRNQEVKRALKRITSIKKAYSF
ncbi:olfactory receptor 1020-like [Tachyglossus aculeatus]|uniref:olfactory receptor 1020-like n=1 Tax=Tachyglossus aculeatus TaxID=9261 RepID=UPI0018F40905|nr:olfactory receptor 1020-like [Tachyglossus aculeatus]